MIRKYKLLQLFEVTNEKELNYTDRLLFNDILNSNGRGHQSGGGYSIRPDLGEIAGMVERTGYVDRYPPVFVDELLSDVAFQVNNPHMTGGNQIPPKTREYNPYQSQEISGLREMVTAKEFPVLYINLEKDIHKKEMLEENLQKNGFSYDRIDAIYGKNLNDKSYIDKLSKLLDIPAEKLEPSFWMDRKNFKTMCSYEDVVLAKVGCYLSHIVAIKTALDRNYENVLILEDDSFPLANINTPFHIPDDADMYYLGGGFMHQTKPMNFTNTALEPKHILLDTSKLKLCCTYAYILPNREKMETMYNLFMSVFNDGTSHDIHDDWRTGEPKMRAQSCDFMYINFFQKFGTSYVINPVIFTHKELGSNIVNNRQRYNLSFFYNPRQKKMLDP